MIRRSVAVQNELGLHARAAAKIVKLANEFESDIKLSRENLSESVDAKSILGILLLAASRGTVLQISARGKDELSAVESLVELVNSRFGENR